MDPVAMMQTVVGLMRTMKAFGYDVEEELFKDHEKYKHHKIKGYREEAIQKTRSGFRSIFRGHFPLLY